VRLLVTAYAGNRIRRVSSGQRRASCACRPAGPALGGLPRGAAPGAKSAALPSEDIRLHASCARNPGALKYPGSRNFPGLRQKKQICPYWAFPTGARAPAPLLEEVKI
jgi:hypothetical protein